MTYCVHQRDVTSVCEGHPQAVTNSLLFHSTDLIVDVMSQVKGFVRSVRIHSAECGLKMSLWNRLHLVWMCCQSSKVT